MLDPLFSLLLREKKKHPKPYKTIYEWIWMKCHSCFLFPKRVWWCRVSCIDDEQKQRPDWTTHSLVLLSFFTLVEEHSKTPWLHYLEGLWALTNDSLGGKHLSPYSLYSIPSYGTKAQSLPHIRSTDNKHTETHSSGTSAAARSTPKYSWCCHSGVVMDAGAVVSVMQLWHWSVWIDYHNYAFISMLMSFGV